MINADKWIALQPTVFTLSFRGWKNVLASSSGTSKDLPSSIRIFSWNVDFMAPNAKERLLTVLAHIQTDILGCASGGKPEPCCVLLQEVARPAFSTLLTHKWVREHFSLVPANATKWPSGASYGNVTLVSKGIYILHSYSLEFSSSRMGRNAVFVDVCLASPNEATAVPTHTRSTSRQSRETQSVTLRIANTHLESLPMGSEARPVQLAAIADRLNEDGISCGIVGGDMNMIAPSDQVIHVRAGLLDAYTGAEDDEAGFTWGYQPRCQFPVGRLDRIFYTPGNDALCISHPQIIGVDVRTALGQWASDHYGLSTTVTPVAIS